MRLRKITVISGITLRAHFSLGMARFDTLSNLLLTLDIRGHVHVALAPFIVKQMIFGAVGFSTTASY